MEHVILLREFLTLFSSFPLAKLYRLSPLWYGAIGALSTISIGWIVSMVTRESSSLLHSEVLNEQMMHNGLVFVDRETNNVRG